ncbi:MAG: HIRAN domain-containing protein [Flavisolibacter sp.]
MHEFDKIFLSWRQGQGSRRHIVGVLREEAGKYVFSYDQDAVELALTQGFRPYTEFPDINTTYNGNTLDIFAQRLTRTERPDIQSFYDFWEIEPQFRNDKFYLLGHTQGLLPTDNFEFLADYNPVDGIHFLTELAGLSQLKLPKDSLEIGDSLTFVAEKDNKYDPEAVKVFKDGTEVGYIKKIHCRVFHKPGAEDLKLTVKAIDKNGFIKRAFIKVSK